MSSDIINQLASVHLGKAGDGSVVKPYVTPDNIDPSLLVPVPRHLNRTGYGIEDDNLPFVGYDTWNCYEFSTLTNNGFPVSGVIRLVYASHTPNIVESKSLKLYLNSFNMHKSGDTILDVVEFVENQIEVDLHGIGISASACFHDETAIVTQPIQGDFLTLENFCDVESMTFDHYNEDPAILEVIDNPDYYDSWKSHSLRSNCRVTNQPDWGDVYIHIGGDKTVTPESLLQYIVSMRKENHFHEEICECIYKRLLDTLNPEELMVACLYTRRGGIDINPVRAKGNGTMFKYAGNLVQPDFLNYKTMRQ